MNEVLLFIGKKSTSHVGFRERRLACNKGDQTKGVDKTGMPEERKAELHGEDKRVMELALQAGHILLENGAEIFRVEETIDRICRHYGLESGSTFVLSNGIFITAGNERENFFAKVQHIPVSGTHLNYMIIGSIMLLIPGVAFTNANREMAERQQEPLLFRFCSEYPESTIHFAE